MCLCYNDPVKGFWTGGDLHGGVCDKCKPGVYGPQCRLPCPGGLCAPCNNNGKCYDGISGNGTCACYSSPVRGYWSGSACSECALGYYGASCKIKCNCSSHGRCLIDDVSLQFSCQCLPGWAGGFCDDCGYGHYGSECQVCPNVVAKNQPDGTAGFAVCGGRGICDGGIYGTGRCTCVCGRTS
jgi:hypothetical protein